MTTDEADERENTRRFRWLLGSVLASGLAIMAAAIAIKGARAGSSAAVGVAIAAVNLVAFRFIIRALVAAVAGTGQSGGVAGVLLGLKLAILVAGVWLLQSSGLVSLAPLIVGYCALPIGVAIGTLLCDKAHAS